MQNLLQLHADARLGLTLDGQRYYFPVWCDHELVPRRELRPPQQSGPPSAPPLPATPHLALAFDVQVSEVSLCINGQVRKPHDLDVSEWEVCMTCAGERLCFRLPVRVWPDHPLNASKYGRKPCILILQLRRLLVITDALTVSV